MQKLLDLVKVMNENIQRAEIENSELINHIYEGKYPKKVDALDMSDYTSNPYSMQVMPKPSKLGSLELFYDHYEKNQMFLYDEVSIGEKYKEKSNIGYFNMPYEFLALKKDDKIWMSVTPHEINTMAEAIKQAKGRVLVLGLGLGYFPFMISSKEEVSRVTVIENDPEVIAMFKENLRPYFPYRKKIKILEGDGLVLTSKQPYYDYIFADLWHQPREAIPLYLKLKQQETSKKQYFYWIEKSILALLRRCVLIVLEEVSYGATAKDYRLAETEDDKLINAVYKALSKRKFELDLDDSSLADFAKEIRL